jgi:nucleotide-binding universal stress UspA family protein
MKTLVCTDGSDQAERAVRLTAELAAACEGDVTLLGIQETPGQSESILAALRRGQQLLEARRRPVELVTKCGDAIEEIVRWTEATNYDLVVIGAVRKGFGGPFSMSAKVYKIIKLIKPPVLVVAGNPSFIERILVCSGGKGYIEGAFDLVGKIAKDMSGSITLLHVMPEPPAIYTKIYRMEIDVEHVLNSRSELGRNLRREREQLRGLGIETRVRLRQGLVLEEVFEEIRSGQYDLVVTGSSLSMGPLRTYVLGDVTREIVNRADRPVLVARHAQRPLSFRTRLKDLLHGFTFSSAASGGSKSASG